ncbi:MAG: hypothetical protein KKF44_00470 [Nanoarchaeota archaeon]|nr:hypothetical protein [Nanoarchaeota archaeon]
MNGMVMAHEVHVSGVDKILEDNDNPMKVDIANTATLNARIAEILTRNSRECKASIMMKQLNDDKILIDFFSNTRLPPMSSIKYFFVTFYYITIGSAGPDTYGYEKWNEMEKDVRLVSFSSNNIALSRLMEVLDKDYHSDEVLIRFREFLELNGFYNTIIKQWSLEVDPPVYVPKPLCDSANLENIPDYCLQECDYCIECNLVTNAYDSTRLIEKIHDMSIVINAEGNLRTLTETERQRILSAFQKQYDYPDGLVGVNNRDGLVFYSRMGAAYPAGNQDFFHVLFPRLWKDYGSLVGEWTHYTYSDVGLIQNQDDYYSYGIYIVDCLQDGKLDHNLNGLVLREIAQIMLEQIE